ncbi:MAG TPA: leucine-rich repeat domain-containing protein [Clostridiales bacterium]|jgi:hypothetical protein|nr:leucine-rich repeat domain-containing protein [Clostridiales bacterium]
MKQITKKLLVAALLVMLVAGVFAPSVSADGGVWDYEYIINPDGSVTITAYHGSGSLVAIPEKLGGRPVREIGAGVFAGQSEIKEVYFENGVSVICEGAFSGCSLLSSLVLPPSVEIIGDKAFFGCSSLEEIDFAEGLREIGEGAFSGTALEYVCLPATLEAVGEGAFAGSTPLKFIVATNPSSAAIYGAGCFGGAKVYGYTGSASRSFAATEQLEFSAVSQATDFQHQIFSGGVRITGCTGSAEAVVIPGEIAGKKVIAIADKAFSADAGRCANAKIIILPDTLRTIGNFAFSGCASLEYIRMPRRLEGAIGQHAFKNCASLRGIEIPRGISRIEIEAFLGCTSLSEVRLAADVAKIGAGAFYGCAALSKLICEGSEPACDYRDAVPAMVSFAGVGDMTVFIRSGTDWKLSGGRWYPNGTGPEYKGFRVEELGCDNFFVEKILTPVSCANSGVSEFYCPFCGQSYMEHYQRESHRYVSTGIVSGIETFRCIQCNESYMLYHIEHAEISPTVDTERPQGSMMTSAEVKFNGKPLTYGIDYTYTEEYNSEYRRVELVFSGLGEYTGTQKLVYRIADGRWIDAYKVTVVGASGSGWYYHNDIVEMSADPPPGMEAGEWHFSEGVEYMSIRGNAATFVMPARDVTVTLTFVPVEETTTDTEYGETTTTELEPETTTTPPEEQTTELPDEPTEPPETEPFIITPEGWELVKKAIIWGVVLLVSLSALVVASIILLKKEKT